MLWQRQNGLWRHGFQRVMVTEPSRHMPAYASLPLWPPLPVRSPLQATPDGCDRPADGAPLSPVSDAQPGQAAVLYFLLQRVSIEVERCKGRRRCTVPLRQPRHHQADWWQHGVICAVIPPCWWVCSFCWR
jgi:hypothetical protein